MYGADYKVMKQLDSFLIIDFLKQQFIDCHDDEVCMYVCG